MKKIHQWLQNNILYIVWLQAVAATFGSLFFSEILNYPPCTLCWYQRIAIYPLVLILPVAISKKDRNIALYTLPLSIIGLGIAIFQNLLYYKVIPETLTPCIPGASCTTKFFELFGFISIPFLSMVAFIVTCGSLLYYHLAVNQKNTK